MNRGVTLGFHNQTLSSQETENQGMVYMGFLHLGKGHPVQSLEG